MQSSRYLFQHLRASQNHYRSLAQEIVSDEPAKRSIWGVFSGLFGLASNELISVSYLEQDSAAPAISPRAVHHEVWQATVRPVEFSPCTRAGLYVFRRFHVAAADVAEVVSLSEQAWQSFVDAERYQTQPLGLFCPPADEQGMVKMMLVTWYDGFSSWELSRAPAPAATGNFARRHALTQTTYAMATRLLPEFVQPDA
ncbi:MAG: hypothetical protein ACFHXK_08545 [bacterium]